MDKGSAGPDDGGWERTWNARLAALETLLGPADDQVFHSPIPLHLGGQADVVSFPKFVPGQTFVTADLTGDDSGQQPNSYGNYELMICTRGDLPAAAELISALAVYTFEAVLEPWQTMDINDYFGDSTLRALLFAHPQESPSLFDVLGQECSLLLCIGITAAELDFKTAHGGEALLEKLRAAKVFPYTVLDRPSTV